MRNRFVISILAAAVVAGCGGAGPGGPATNKAPAATQQPGGGGGGAVDCAALRAAAEKLVGIQLLAQLRTPESIESIKTMGTLHLDEMLSALNELHALDRFTSTLGDPKASIDAYVAAATAAKALLAMNPVTQEAIDAFNEEHVPTIGEFLGKQVAISGAMSEADC